MKKRIISLLLGAVIACTAIAPVFADTIKRSEKEYYAFDFTALDFWSKPAYKKVLDEIFKYDVPISVVGYTYDYNREDINQTWDVKAGQTAEKITYLEINKYNLTDEDKKAINRTIDPKYFLFSEAAFTPDNSNIKYLKIGDVNATVTGHAFEQCPDLAAVRFGQTSCEHDVYLVDYLCGRPYNKPGMTGSEKQPTITNEILLDDYNNTAVAKYGFYRCRNLKNVIVDGMDTEFAPMAFLGSNELKFYCPAGSKAETYAKDFGFEYITIPEMTAEEKAKFNAEFYYPYAEDIKDVVSPEDEEILYAHYLKYGKAKGVDAMIGDYKKEMIGDADNDGKLTASDASTVLQYTLAPMDVDENFITRCDVDKDGKITATDASLIMQAVLSGIELK
ncbi:MAG: dockerin type I repeat-containing protein [Firmicutes bacterium]|nr:dockerin type I repeat-containing protein [Bacillota bacterium]